MIRKQVYLTEEQQTVLHELVEATGKSESALIREAIDQLGGRLAALRRRPALEQGFGLWSDREDLPDFEALRREWDSRMTAQADRKQGSDGG